MVFDKPYITNTATRNKNERERIQLALAMKFCEEGKEPESEVDEGLEAC